MTDVDILLDGVSIRDRFEKCTITLDQYAVHNLIQVDSHDISLREAADPSINPGTARLVVTIGADTLNFLIERPLEGDEFSVIIKGRSMSALAEEIYAGQVYYDTGTGYKEAKTVCTALLAGAGMPVLSWYWTTIGDPNSMPMPLAWSFSGAPIEGLQEVASRFSSVVRGGAGNAIEVRPQYKVAPSKIGTVATTPDITLDADYDVIDQIATTEEQGENYNAVRGASEREYDTPEIVVEDGDYRIVDGVCDTAYLRVYWTGDAASRPDVDLFTSSGALSKVGASETVTETVTFASGAARISKPILSLTAYSWLSGDVVGSGVVTAIRGTMTLINDGDDGDCEVTYITEGFINDAEHVEEVTFQDGAASVSHRIKSFNSIVWVGDSGGDLSWTAGDKDIRCAGQGGIATVSYQAEYQRWQLSGATVANVLIGMAQPPLAWVLYKVAGSDGDRIAPEEVSHGGYVGAAQAIWGSYDKVRYSFTIPVAGHTVRDGMILHLSKWPVSGQYVRMYITKVIVAIEEIKEVYQIEAVQLLAAE